MKSSANKSPKHNKMVGILTVSTTIFVCLVAFIYLGLAIYIPAPIETLTRTSPVSALAATMPASPNPSLAGGEPTIPSSPTQITQAPILAVIPPSPIIPNPPPTPEPKPEPVAPIVAPIKAPAPTAPTADPTLPARLKIPAINVDAIIEHVTTTPDGAMATPKDPMQVSWYSPGTRPGNIGSAAMSGHLDWWGGQTGVFKNLSQLVVGDKIMVEDGAGTLTTFVVRSIRHFAPAADATEVFSSNDGLAHLNLITCAGTWNKEAGQYSERMVVFADKVIN